MQKRFIEYDLPLAEISEESAREKNIRHGHPSTLHIWWARHAEAERPARHGLPSTPKRQSTLHIAAEGGPQVGGDIAAVEDYIVSGRRKCRPFGNATHA